MHVADLNVCIVHRAHFQHDLAVAAAFTAPLIRIEEFDSCVIGKAVGWLERTVASTCQPAKAGDLAQAHALLPQSLGALRQHRQAIQSLAGGDIERFLAGSSKRQVRWLARDFDGAKILSLAVEHLESSG